MLARNPPSSLCRQLSISPIARTKGKEKLIWVYIYACYSHYNAFVTAWLVCQHQESEPHPSRILYKKLIFYTNKIRWLPKKIYKICV